ncbi:MAG: formylglycine-generating enzyme family protein [Blastocatellia bacterium]
MAASVLAVTAMIGYASWSQLSKQATNDLPPTGVALTTLTENLANGIKIELVKLPGGEFTMGSNDGDNDEKPPHRVKLSPFAIGKYEVTQRQWKAVMGDNPSNFKGDDLPVERVSWEMVQTFLQRLNGRYRLPTEAEWEYAARAGSQGRYSFGDDENELRNYAWFSDNSNSQTHPVGKLKPNGFGLFDMHGNVREWCSDLYDANYYKQSAGTDPQGPSTGTDRVYRGGGWSNVAVACRSADRSRDAPGGRYDDLGFRLVRVGP